LEKRYLLVQSPEKSYFSHLKKKYCLLKEKILGLYFGGAHHRAYYYCFEGTKKECLYFLCYGAHPLSLVPEPFPLKNKVFLVNVKNRFFPEAELEKSVFTTNPLFTANYSCIHVPGFFVVQFVNPICESNLSVRFRFQFVCHL